MELWDVGVFVDCCFMGRMMQLEIHGDCKIVIRSSWEKKDRRYSGQQVFERVMQGMKI